MAKAQQMLETYPRSFNLDARVLGKTIDALVECANTCTQCADACLSEKDVGVHGEVHSAKRGLRGCLHCHQPDRVATDRVRRERDAGPAQGVHRRVQELW